MINNKQALAVLHNISELTLRIFFELYWYHNPERRCDIPNNTQTTHALKFMHTEIKRIANESAATRWGKIAKAYAQWYWACYSTGQTDLLSYETALQKAMENNSWLAGSQHPEAIESTIVLLKTLTELDNANVIIVHDDRTTRILSTLRKFLNIENISNEDKTSTLNFVSGCLKKNMPLNLINPNINHGYVTLEINLVKLMETPSDYDINSTLYDCYNTLRLQFLKLQCSKSNEIIEKNTHLFPRTLHSLEIPELNNLSIDYTKLTNLFRSCICHISELLRDSQPSESYKYDTNNY